MLLPEETVFSPAPPQIREIPLQQNNSNPLAITVDAAGNAWFAETNPPAIGEYLPASQSFRNFPIPTGNSCGLIWFLVQDNASYLWFSCASEPLLWSFSTTIDRFSNFSTGSSQVDPYSLALDPRTNLLWFTSIYTDQIGAFRLNASTAKLDLLVNMTGPSTPTAIPGGPRFGPSGLAFDSSGNLFVTETFAAAIVEYNPGTQKFLKFWTLPAKAQPVGVVVDDTSGLIWFTNHGSSLIGFVNESSGAEMEFATSLYSFGGAFQITLPYWIQKSSDGSIWFDEHIGNKIARFDPSKNQLTEFYILTPQAAPLRFALDNSRKVLWFTEFQGNNLGELDENQSCNCGVAISPKSLVLSSQSVNLIANFATLGSWNFTRAISGSLSATGDLTSNLSISFKSLNSSAFEATITPGANLRAGNYSITVCPGNNDSSGLPCRIAQLTFLGTATVLSNLDYVVISGATIIVVALVSIVYVRRWRRS